MARFCEDPDSTYWADNCSDRFAKPEQQLWFAVLEHALRDADHVRQILKPYNRKVRHVDIKQAWLFEVETSRERHDELLELLAWFESPVEHVAGTFGFICNCLMISDEAKATMVKWVRNRIKQRACLAA